MGSDTRDRIVRASARLFHEQGFAATSIADVLDAAGVNSGSLYHFFAGKTALLEAVLSRHIELLRPSLLEAAERTTSDPVERVFALLDHYRRNLVASGCTMGCPVGQLALEVGHRAPEARQLADRYFSQWIAGVEGWLRGSAIARLPAGDPTVVACHVLAVVEGSVVQAIAAGTVAPFDAAVAALQAWLGQLGAGPQPPVATSNDTAVERPAAAADQEAEETGWRSW